MKKIYILTILYTLFLITGCKKDFLELTPLDKVPEDAVWTDAALMKAYVNGLYNSYSHGFNRYMWSRYSDECYGENNIHMRTYNADNISSYASANAGWLDFWDRGYQYIRRCNLFFEQVDGSPLQDADKIRLKGEVRFIRAFIYANLIWRYGAVPIVDDSYTLGDTSTFTRNTYDECVKYISDELDSAIVLLPAKYEKTKAEYGRATKHACMALKSRVYLYAASPLNNPTNDLTKWRKAADLAKAVIELNAYTLSPNYRDMFQAVNDEYIFCRTFNSSTGHNATWLNSPRFFGGYGGWGGRNCPSVNLVNDYEMSNGTAPFNPDGTVNPASGYDSTAPHVNRDPRFYASIIYHGAVWQGHTFDYSIAIKGFNANGTPQLTTTYGVDNYKVSGDNSKTNYNLRKFMDENVPVSNTTKYTQPWPYFRLAEMYLNYAEAEYQLGQADSARDAINTIRLRAGMPPVPSSESGDSLWRRIMNERRIELVFEGHRFFDIRRWKIAPIVATKIIKGRDVYILPDKSIVYYHTNLINVPSTWNDKFYLLPIQRAEINKNQGTLLQNPGFE